LPALFFRWYLKELKQRKLQVNGKSKKTLSSYNKVWMLKSQALSIKNLHKHFKIHPDLAAVPIMSEQGIIKYSFTTQKPDLKLHLLRCG
jgi:hypothetical protein